MNVNLKGKFKKRDGRNISKQNAGYNLEQQNVNMNAGNNYFGN